MEIKPVKGEPIVTMRDRFAKSGMDIATIDNNKDGKFNYGKNSGDTIKVFDWENKTATGHHLVKPGELGYANGTPAGKVDTTTAPLGRTIKNTFKDLSEKEIKARYPNSILVNPSGDGKFSPGSTIIFKSADGSRHNAHYVKDGEIPATTLKMTGAKDILDVKSDRGILSGDVVWSDILAK